METRRAVRKAPRSWLLIFLFVLWPAPGSAQDNPVLGALDVLWTFDLPGGATNSGVPNQEPALGPDGTIYVTYSATNSDLVTLQAIGPDGRSKWVHQVQEGWVAPPSVGSDGTVYFTAGDSLYAVRSDGSLAWSADTGGLGPAIGVDGTLYVRFFDKGLVAIDLAGKERWRFETDGQVIQSPIIGRDRSVYVVDEFGTLFAIAPNGAEKWRYQTPPLLPMKQLATSDDGTILLPTEFLQAIGPNGTLKWKSDERIENQDFRSSAPVVGFHDELRFPGAFDDEPWTINIGQGTSDLTGFPVAELAEINGDSGAVSPARVIILNGTRQFILSDFQLNTAPAISLHPNKPVSQARALPGGGYDNEAFKDENRAGGILYAPSGDSLFAITKDRDYYVGDIFEPSADDGVNLFGSPTIGVEGRVYVVAALNGGGHRLYAFAGKPPRSLTPSEPTPPWPMLYHDARHTSMDTTEAPRVEGVIHDSSGQPEWTWASNGGDGVFRYALNGADLTQQGATAATSFVPPEALPEGGHLLSVQELIGNRWSNPGTFPVRVDLTPPTTVATLKTSSGGKVTVELSCDDGPGSGCEDLFFDKDQGAGEEPYQGPISVDERTNLSFWSSDGAGNVESKRQIQGGRAATSIKLELSQRALLPGNRLEVAGKLSRLPEISQDLSGLLVLLEITGPTGVTSQSQARTSSSTGQFKFSRIGGFNREGEYTLKVRFIRTDLLEASESTSHSVFVGQSAGYAVLVQGKLGSDRDDRRSHSKTTDRIYKSLIARGFRPEDIRYFRYQDGGDRANIQVNGKPIQIENPSKPEVRAAIESWAVEKANDVPAPVYVVLVNHGSKEAKFHLGAASINAIELDRWLGALESKLEPEAKDKPRVVVLGACYSGSFIPRLSSPGRIVLTSATADEVSYKGPLEDDNIRVGEFFLEALFGELGRGEPLGSAFVTATGQTEIFTRRGGGTNSNSSDPFADGAVQHPLLDDNGDGRGSNVLTPGGDGTRAKTLFLGVRPPLVTNAPAARAAITEVTKPLYLSADERDAILRATVNDAQRTVAVWAEVRTLSEELKSDVDSTVQLANEKQVQTLFSNNDPTDPRKFEKTYRFTEPGRYEIAYYARDLGDELSRPLRSVVYKDRLGNQPPGRIDLLSPADGATTRTVGLFAWRQVTDPDGNPVTYNLVIGADFGLRQELHRQDGLTVPFAAIDARAGLSSPVTYYWRVEAVDAFGARSFSETRRFNTDDPNNLAGVIQGLVLSNLNQVQLAGATMSVQQQQPLADVSQCVNGACTSISPSGTVSVEFAAPGHEAKRLEVDVPPGETETISVLLDPMPAAETADDSDLDGDGTADIFWRNQINGANRIWKMTNLVPKGKALGALNTNWQVAGTGDFDDDGTADIFWRNQINGANYIWKMTNLVPTGQALVALNTNWQVAGIGDFDGDGTADIFWRNQINGANYIWKMTNLVPKGNPIGVLNTNWQVAGIGDFDGDGTDDIFWRNQINGANTIWKMTNVVPTGEAFAPLPITWQIAGIGDFNGDGTSDLFWRNRVNGGNVIWELTEFVPTGRRLAALPIAWRLGHTGDFNGDGTTDIVWRHSATGGNAIWEMQGSVPTNQPLPPRPDTAWEIQR